VVAVPGRVSLCVFPSVRRILLPTPLAVRVVAIVGLTAAVGATVPALAAPSGTALRSVVSVSVPVDAADADGDTVPDVVERVVCGTATCASGAEDRDGDGVPDWTEVLSCDSATCADPAADADGDGIPDFAERLVCGSDTCSNSTEDADGDRVGDWVEFVVCGTRACADGTEDLDGNGVSDAAELAACVVRVDDRAGILAVTGGVVAIWVAVVGALLVGVGFLIRVVRRRRRVAAAVAGDDGVDVGDLR
jgi:hypothetical protein